MISASWLFTSLLIGGIGMALFVYGKRQSRPPQLVTGLLLMVYPYFVRGAGWMIAVAVFLLAVLWVALRLGW